MDDKITIIEGPPPTFETFHDGWALGLNEGPYLASIALTRLRTFNSSALIERCHRAWSQKNSMQLEFRDLDGLESRAPIVAARALEGEEGQVLLLWVKLEAEEEQETSQDDDWDDDIDDNAGFPG